MSENKGSILVGNILAGEKPIEQSEAEKKRTPYFQEYATTINLISKYYPGKMMKGLDKEVIIQQEKLDKTTLEIEKKVAQRKDFAPKTFVDESLQKKKGIEKRLECTDKALNQMMHFGNELVTNVKLANEKREVIRRNEEALLREGLLIDLEQESKEAFERYDAIMEKWPDMREIKEPMSLFDALEEQKESIFELLKQKDDIIKKCQDEISRTDQRYYNDLRRQTTDLATLASRVNSQIDLMKDAFKEHLELLQQKIDEERINIAQKAANKWQEIYDKNTEFEEIRQNIKKEKKEFYDKEIVRIEHEQNEQTRSTRIRLERDCEALQLELRKMRNNVIMNAEKLDYNCQVLQKRNEENSIVSNQQKRRLGKILETISSLRKKIRVTKKDSEAIIKKLTGEVLNLHAGITELEIKADKFKIINEKKYNRVWDMNFQEALKLLQNLLDIDKILYEQQLGIDWTQPDIPLPRPKKKEKVKDVPTAASVKEVKSKEEISDDKLQKNNRLLRNVMRQISDGCGFLLEDKLLQIIEPHIDVNKTIARVDNIFNALKINNCNDIESLLEYFLPYSSCPNCETLTQNSSEDLIHVDASRVSAMNNEISDFDYDDGSEIEMDNSTDSTSIVSYETDELDNKVEDIFKLDTSDFNELNSIRKERISKYEKGAKVEQVKQCPDHYLVMNPAFVLTALKEYAERNTTVPFTKSIAPIIQTRKSLAGQSLGQSVQSFTPSADGSYIAHKQKGDAMSISRRDVKQYWSQFLRAFPDEKLKLWKGLQHGLNHFLVVLREREELDQRCEFLRNQNAEFRFLLQRYLTDENAEPECPKFKDEHFKIKKGSGKDKTCSKLTKK